jgi:hypothetical protein
LQQLEEQHERKCVKKILMAWQSQWTVTSSLSRSRYHSLDKPHSVGPHWAKSSSLLKDVTTHDIHTRPPKPLLSASQRPHTRCNRLSWTMACCDWH